MVSEESDSMGRAYIVFNEANSHLLKVHLPTFKRKITSRLAPRVYVKTRVSWREGWGEGLEWESYSDHGWSGVLLSHLGLETLRQTKIGKNRKKTKQNT